MTKTKQLLKWNVTAFINSRYSFNRFGEMVNLNLTKFYCKKNVCMYEITLIKLIMQHSNFRDAQLNIEF